MRCDRAVSEAALSATERSIVSGIGPVIRRNSVKSASGPAMAFQSRWSISPSRDNRLACKSARTVMVGAILTPTCPVIGCRDWSCPGTVISTVSSWRALSRAVMSAPREKPDHGLGDGTRDSVCGGSLSMLSLPDRLRPPNPLSRVASTV